MRVLRVKICILLLVVSGSLMAQTVSPNAIDPGEFARLIQKKKQDNRQTFAAQLLVAERAFVAEDYTKALFHYEKAAALGAPNSRWYLGKSALYQALGDDLNAQLVIKEGIKVYPFSNRLALAHARQTVLKRDRLPSDEELDKMKLPAVAKVQVKALLAFRQNDFIRGLLETERAHYLAPDELLDTELAQKYLQTSYNFSVAYVEDDCGTGSIPNHVPYQTGTFEDVYLRSVESAVRTYNTHQKDSLGDIRQLVRLSEIRTTILRDFVKKGHLGRFQDPMLVDLYILDNADHLTSATLGMFLKSLGPIDSESEQQISPYLPKIAAAQQYMDTQWSKDVDAFLERF